LRPAVGSIMCRAYLAARHRTSPAIHVTRSVMGTAGTMVERKSKKLGY
jgi:hypothetical protein